MPCLNNKCVCVIDTETSGLDCNANVMLSLSYLVLKDGEIIFDKSFYFDYPNDESKINARAIEVNGLTKERLALLGTTPKRDALETFLNDTTNCEFVAGHNVQFDLKFLKAAAASENVRCNKSMTILDTAVASKNIVKLTGFDNQSYKYPKLRELCDFLNIQCEADLLHSSKYDTFVTYLCLLKLDEMDAFTQGNGTFSWVS